jgi:hypothetical protein
MPCFYINSGLLLVYLAPADCSGWELRLHLRLPPPDSDVWRDISVAPEGFIADINTTGLTILAYASGTLGLGLAQIFLFSA